MKSPFSLRRALTRRCSKPEQIVDHLEFIDFKVLSVQKLVSCKLDDHLRVLNPEATQRTQGSNQAKSYTSIKEAPESSLNPFLEAKLTILRSHSAKHQSEKKPLRHQEIVDEEDLLDFRTTYRVQRKKEGNLEAKSLKELESKLREGQPYFSRLKIF